MGVGVFDITFNAIVSIYHFFDPKYAHLSPSTLLPLRELEYLRKFNKEIDGNLIYYYMGLYYTGT